MTVDVWRRCWRFSLQNSEGQDLALAHGCQVGLKNSLAVPWGSFWGNS